MVNRPFALVTLDDWDGALQMISAFIPGSMSEGATAMKQLRSIREGWFCVSLCVCAVGSACASKPVAKVPYEQSFDRPLGAEWQSSDPRWQVVDGRLFNDGAHNVPLWLSASLPDDVAVEMDAESKSRAVDIKFEIFGDGVHHQSGYVVILAGWNNSKSIIARLDEHGPERTAAETARLAEDVQKGALAAAHKHGDRREIVARKSQMQSHKVYGLRFVRRGGWLRFYVDDALHLELFDPAPLAGKGHDRFAFSNWASLVYFDNLRITPL